MSAHDHVSSFDEAKFRQVLGYYPTGVVVVTAMDDERKPAGLAIGSFTSVSIDPPLIAFFPNKKSSSWPKIEAAGTFCVNILGEDQEDVSRVFASKGTDKFASIGWTPGRTSAPVLNGVIAWIECTIERVDDAGDHLSVLGRVVDLNVGQARGGPLIFFRGGYGRYEL
jgi:flavin reductase (DIM6/NTAB) family NADH-FMN oxidoreductase RutF